MTAADAFVAVMPEYNVGFSAALALAAADNGQFGRQKSATNCWNASNTPLANGQKIVHQASSSSRSWVLELGSYGRHAE